jgi:glutaredoxin
MKKTLVILLFISFILVLSGCQGSDSGKIIFYYSLTCPHCKNVEKYVADNNVKAKVDFIEKEVSENMQNATDFMNKVAKCGIKPEEAGVPLLWDGSTCLVGDEPIINYFFTKINEK